MLQIIGYTIFFTFILLDIFSHTDQKKQVLCMKLQKQKKKKKDTNSEFNQLAQGTRVQSSWVNYYSYKMKGVWGLGSAVMYTSTIITSSHCMPVLKKKN